MEDLNLFQELILVLAMSFLFAVCGIPLTIVYELEKYPLRRLVIFWSISALLFFILWLTV